MSAPIKEALMKTLTRFFRCESGATAIEYCLIASGISIVIAVVVSQLGTTLNGSYAAVSDALKKQ
jgi:pilus assembly protein Flp/PilA